MGSLGLSLAPEATPAENSVTNNTRRPVLHNEVFQCAGTKRSRPHAMPNSYTGQVNLSLTHGLDHQITLPKEIGAPNLLEYS